MAVDENEGRGDADLDSVRIGPRSLFDTRSLNKLKVEADRFFDSADRQRKFCTAMSKFKLI
jgi:hypothetical protein